MMSITNHEVVMMQILHSSKIMECRIKTL